jgi:hypothetical protein
MGEQTKQLLYCYIISPYHYFSFIQVLLLLLYFRHDRLNVFYEKYEKNKSKQNDSLHLAVHQSQDRSAFSNLAVVVCGPYAFILISHTKRSVVDQICSELVVFLPKRF